MSWSSVPAAELMVKRGGSVNPSKFPDETFELLSIPAFDKNEPEILKGSEIGSSKSCIEPGDVLLSKIVPHIRRCWVVPMKGEHRQIGSGEWIIFRDDRFDSRFLRHFLTSNVFHNQFMNTVAGVGGSLVRARPAGVELIEIPLPPLAEQTRIAAILDKADAIRRKRQQAIQLADEFLRAVFLDMFGDIPAKKSKYQFIGCRGYVSASSGKSSRDVFSEIPTEIPIYGGNGVNGYATRSLYDEPVIVLGRVGQQCAITNLTSGPAWVTDNAIVVQVTDSSRYNPVYLAYAFMHSPIRDTVTRLDLPFINQSMILDAPIPLPPIELQNKFEKIREKTFQLIRGFTESAGKTQSCFSALSQKAFSGEL